MSIKINKFEIENVKRVKAVQVEPSATGLTVIGGRNAQGKTSTLDAIAWALGGNKFRPSDPQREGSVVPPHLHIELSNGLVVERKGKNSDLKVIDPSGNRAGQNLLDEFISQLALDLPKFMQANDKEKASTLLQIIGVGDKLFELENSEKELYNQRLTIGQIADQKKKYAAEMPVYADAPAELVSAADLIKQQQEILARNGENQKKRAYAAEIQRSHEAQLEMIAETEEKLARMREQLASTERDLETAKKSAEQLQDESTAELEKSIADIEETNRKVRVNLDKDKAQQEADEYGRRYDDLTNQIEKVRKDKIDLLDGADLPLPELSVEDGALTYQGKKWDGMGGADQLKVATAIVRKLNPKCGFVLMDKLEQMDLETMKEFGEWLQAEGLQVIATRVSTGDECSIIIQDGYSHAPEATKEELKWKKGGFLNENRNY